MRIFSSTLLCQLVCSWPALSSPCSINSGPYQPVFVCSATVAAQTLNCTNHHGTLRTLVFGAHLQQLHCHFAAPMGWHLKNALVVLEHVLLQEELEDSRVILVSPDEDFCKGTQRLDDGGLVYGVDDLVLGV
jgi:hypothetical protein